MKFNEEQLKDIEEKLFRILMSCMQKAKATNDMTFIESWYFMEQVYKANLVQTNKEWFMLGELADKIHRLGPKAFEAANAEWDKLHGK